MALVLNIMTDARPLDNSFLATNEMIPRLQIPQYLQRLYKYFNSSPCCFVAAFVYIDRYLQKTTTSIHKGNVHYMFCTALVISCKFLDDFIYSNKHYADICGISLTDLNRFERHFITTIEFECVISDCIFKEYENLFSVDAIV
jgi:hypothetical protein